ncbi:MAG: hypothetical protein IPK19_00450 [Chloroflexi bacterium]|nr:hypothetical protein [Chloroflexota bacterium]
MVSPGTLLTDQEYGGLYQNFDAFTLQPVGLDKANIWKVNYHYAMFVTEALRLQAQFSDLLTELDVAASGA